MAAISLLLLWLAPAADAKLALRAEKSFNGARHQHALVFEKESLRLTRNSDFFCRPGVKAFLGTFEKQLDAGWRVNAQYSEQLQLRLDRAARVARETGARSVANGGVLDHKTRFYVGAHDVSGDPDQATVVNGMMKQSCGKLEEWKPVDGVILEAKRGARESFIEITEFKNGAKKETRKVSLEKARCRQLAGALTCRFPRWGTAKLLF